MTQQLTRMYIWEENEEKIFRSQKPAFDLHVYQKIGLKIFLDLKVSLTINKQVKSLVSAICNNVTCPFLDCLR